MRNIDGKKDTVIALGDCTPAQLFGKILPPDNGTFCVLGSPARGIGIAKYLLRRENRPFLFIGPESDSHSAFQALAPDWIADSAQGFLQNGNGALLLAKARAAYLDLCSRFENWCRERFLILHLGSGVQLGPELLDQLSEAGQCLIFSESVPNSLRRSEAGAVAPKEFLSKMGCLIAFSAGGCMKDLIDVLPTYQGDKVTETVNYNRFSSHPFCHPFRLHIGQSISTGQTHTPEYGKKLFEENELQKHFDSGRSLVYTARDNGVFFVQLL